MEIPECEYCRFFDAENRECIRGICIYDKYREKDTDIEQRRDVWKYFF